MRAPPHCTTPKEHTEGFEIGYGGVWLSGKRIYLTGPKETHEQKQCPGCGLWSIVEPIDTKEVKN